MQGEAFSYEDSQAAAHAGQQDCAVSVDFKFQGFSSPSFIW